MVAAQKRVFLNHVQPIHAPYRIAQQEAIAWLTQALQRSLDNQPTKASQRALQLYERLLANTSIQSRRTVLADYTHQSWDDMELYRPAQRSDGQFSPWHLPTLESRMSIFAQEALRMAETAFLEVNQPPSSIIEVSCTGYDAPYAAQRLLLSKNWQSQTKLLKLGHMGCYASVPALNLASDLIKAQTGQRSVSILSTELCSLHLRPAAVDPDQIIANILFADGAVRMDVSQHSDGESLELIDHAETMIPDTLDCMTWKLCDSSFYMTLSKKVGLKVGEVVQACVTEFLAKHKLTLADIQRFAVHPGGPLIIETVQKALDLPESSVEHSKKILREYGNMSSCTLPFIWQSLMQDSQVQSHDKIVSLAFGPGLTLVMNLMQKHSE